MEKHPDILLRELCERWEHKRGIQVSIATMYRRLQDLNLRKASDTTEVFITYVREALAPQLWRGAFVIMDNLPVHKAQKIQEIIETVGAKVIFLPPYSPDLSPIELCW